MVSGENKPVLLVKKKNCTKTLPSEDGYLRGPPPVLTETAYWVVIFQGLTGDLGAATVMRTPGPLWNAPGCGPGPFTTHSPQVAWSPYRSHTHPSAQFPVIDPWHPCGTFVTVHEPVQYIDS